MQVMQAERHDDPKKDKGFFSSSALRISVKRTYPASDQTAGGTGRTFTVSLVTPTRWDQYKKIDKCARK